jgi:hypothetical protein
LGGRAGVFLGGVEGNDGHALLAASLASVLHFAINQREQGVVFAHPHTRARVNLRAELTNNDIPSADVLATKLLDAPTLTDGVATVACAALSLLMSHGLVPRSGVDLADLYACEALTMATLLPIPFAAAALEHHDLPTPAVLHHLRLD